MTSTRWGTRAIIPRISGRSGSRLDRPIPRRPRARRVPRCLGFTPIAERTWVTRNQAVAGPAGVESPDALRGVISAHLREQVVGAPALAVSTQHGTRRDLVGLLAPQRGDLVG